jgi:tetratricopeptide (TPR) repeat protein
MPETAPDVLILGLIHEGWDHLKRQRPLAAWASWRRALRLEPEQPAAAHALHVLANVGDLPEAARVEYRFLTPSDDARRQAWDAQFRGQNLENLAVAAKAFAILADQDPGDSHARFNQGICLAWLGRNADAVETLDLAVRSMAEAEPDTAVDAWTLTEILRQGAGAEPLADDLSHVIQIAWTTGDDPSRFLDDRPEIRPIPNPTDPVTGEPKLSEARLYEWLDRPWIVEPISSEAATADLRQVRATVVRLPGSLRLSATDPVLLEEVFEEVARVAGSRFASVHREASPLPLAFLDAAVWAIRMPTGLDEEARARLNRSAVERYYESVWIIRPRKGLDGRSPVEAGKLASEGDLIARAKLSAVVRLREQLGMRRTTTLLYQGYPFDRLRRRLGLEPTDPEAIDPLDAASMSGPELDKLAPADLDDFALADAYESAAALGEDRRTARFASILAGREPSSLARLDRRALFATLVRHELAEDSTTGALVWIDRAQAVDLALNDRRDRQTYEIWRAEVFVRVGEPDQAMKVYNELIRESKDAWLAIDAAETLLDAGFDDQGRTMARSALDRAELSDQLDVIERAKELLLGETA